MRKLLIGLFLVSILVIACGGLTYFWMVVFTPETRVTPVDVIEAPTPTNENTQVPYLRTETKVKILPETCTINANMVNFRKGPGDEYPRVDPSFFFTMNDVVIVIDPGSWLFVEYQGKSGYVSSEYCR